MKPFPFLLVPLWWRVDGARLRPGAYGLVIVFADEQNRVRVTDVFLEAFRPWVSA